MIMTKPNYAIENLLRPPVEWYSAFAYLMGSGMIFAVPSAFLLSSFLAKVLSLILFLLSVQRFREGYRIYHYQRHLNQLPHYALSSKDIPKSTQHLFLGRGFEWKPIHTQRLRDTLFPHNARYLQQGLLYRLARHLEIKFKNSFVAKVLKNSSRFNPVRPISPVGGNPALHGVEVQEQDVLLPLRERVGHMLVLGTTRVGKTRLLEVLVTQDIHRGDTVIVFDPKGDADLLRRLYFEARLCGREADLIIFHLGFPDISARYNPIGNFARVTEVANRVANQLPGSGESAAFKEFGWRFVNIIAKVLVALGRIPDYQQIQRYIMNIDDLLLEYCNYWLPKVDPHWEQAVAVVEQELNLRELPINLRGRSSKMVAIVKYIQSRQFYDELAEGLCSAFNYDKSYFDKITASLLPLIEKLTTGKSAELISPNYFDLMDTRPIFDWLQVIRGKKIVYVGLDALSDTTVAGAVGNSMFNDLCSVAGQLYKYGVEGQTNHDATKKFHPISLHADEFNEIIGDEFVPLLNKGGGAGIQITAYTQTWSDVEACLGTRAKAGQVGGNFNSLICMRVLEEATARLLTDKLPQAIQVSQLNQISGVSDSSNLGSHTDFSSTNEDRILLSDVPLLAPADVMSLPKGQAYALFEGTQRWKLRIPLPKDDMQGLPQSIETMARMMRANIKHAVNSTAGMTR